MSDARLHPPSPSLGPMASLSTGSSLSPELERDYFKEKVEHFKVLVRNLQEEVQSYKLRKEGTATVSKLLQESKQEVVTLTKRVRAYDSVVRILQSRLEKHGLSSEITLQDDEQYLPSNSKNLIDNLTRENHRLRNVIKTNSGDPEEFARLQQALNEGKQTNSHLQTRIVELEEVLRASDNDKDRTITQLREELSHLNRELNARDFKCSSLAKEADKLQKQLEDVAFQCHDLAKKLQEQSSSSETTKTSETHRKGEVPMDVNEDNVVLTEEIKALKIRVQEITDMNKRWQEYNKQRETYVTQMTRELHDLKSNQEQQANHDVNRDFELQMNQVLDEARKNIEAETRQKNQVQVQLDSANRNILALTEEVRLLKQSHVTERNPGAEETIQALKAQIQICTEDFESERKDREKAQTKISRQESELMRLRKEVDDLRRQRDHWLSSAHPHAYPQTQYTDPFYHYQPAVSPGSLSTERLAPRGVTKNRQIDQYNVIDGLKTQHDGVEIEKCDSIKIVTHDNDDAYPAEAAVAKNRSSDDEYPSLRTSSLSSNSNRASRTPSPRRSENASPVCDVPVKRTPKFSECLKCPKCAKEYSVDEHRELLEHVEICCE